MVRQPFENCNVPVTAMMDAVETEHRDPSLQCLGSAEGNGGQERLLGGRRFGPHKGLGSLSFCTETQETRNSAGLWAEVGGKTGRGTMSLTASDLSGHLSLVSEQVSFQAVAGLTGALGFSSVVSLRRWCSGPQKENQSSGIVSVPAVPKNMMRCG